MDEQSTIEEPSQVPRYNLRPRAHLCDASNYHVHDVFLTASSEPLTFKEAIAGPDGEKWKEAIEE